MTSVIDLSMCINMEIITLSNGKRVGNFSSPHPFTFVDGNVLPAVTENDAKRLQVEFIEYKLNDKGDVSLKFNLSADIRWEMDNWIMSEVDVVFCPLPMITALVETKGREWLLRSPFRAIRMEDRIKKLVSITKQCI